MQIRNQLAGLLLLSAVAIACADSSPTEPTLSGGLDQGTAGRWTTSTPEGQGLDASVLAELEARISNGEFGDVSSLLVLRNGVLVYELYRGGWTSDDLHRVYSVTKSVTSLAVGIAVQEGLLSGLQSGILDFFPEHADVPDAETKASITLEHVLQMRTGWEWDEQSTNYSNDANPVGDLVDSTDWIRFVLDLPLAETPGSRFAYNSGVSMLMAGVLGNLTGAPAEDFVAGQLFGPLSIATWDWDTGPGELTNSGWGLHLRPRDMAALGQLVLQDGVWEGADVVPADWIAQS
ncbi:MAG: serine hydrolase domain-containing protein, partial [Longimicrobiales bacterium]